MIKLAAGLGLATMFTLSPAIALAQSDPTASQRLGESETAAQTTPSTVDIDINGDDDDDSKVGLWGLAGLAGLLGLAGLAGRRRQHSDVAYTPPGAHSSTQPPTNR